MHLSFAFILDDSCLMKALLPKINTTFNVVFCSAINETTGLISESEVFVSASQSVTCLNNKHFTRSSLIWQDRLKHLYLSLEGSTYLQCPVLFSLILSPLRLIWQHLGSQYTWKICTVLCCRWLQREQTKTAFINHISVFCVCADLCVSNLY